MKRETLREIMVLRSLPGMGSATFKKMAEHFGSASAILKAPEKGLRPFLRQFTTAFTAAKNAKSAWREADAEMNRANKEGARVVTYFDPEYPALLKEISDPPIFLYVKGMDESWNTPKVAIVGSREASLYGLRVARRLAQDLASRGVVIVSGMARGIDRAAHEGALEAGGVTWAVQGGGLSRLYPAENKPLAARIERSGLLISEFPMETEPDRTTFPIRNRIVSGLSLGAIIVEAGRKSGALITAGLALDQGRDVFAVPGNIDSARSEGANSLIREGARPVSSAQDVLTELKLAPARALVCKGAEPLLSDDERAVLGYLENDGVQVDDLSERSGWEMRRLSSALSLLEIKGRVKQLPGKYFLKI